MTPVFSLESHLVAVLKETVSSRIGSADGYEFVCVLSEVRMSQSIPDLVLVRRIHTADVQHYVKLSGRDAWILGELTKRSLKPRTLMRRLYLRCEDTLASLELLERNNLVIRTRSGAYRLASAYSQTFQLVAVEAKLTRWREALEQAKSYLIFCDESYVALPAATIDADSRVVECCRRAGIGLLSVYGDGITTVLQPQRTKPDVKEWTWLLAKTIGVPSYVTT